MRVIAADHDRLYTMPGLPRPARRPVDIDTSNTGFTRLRSLRLYRFEAGSVIHGHAEDDEVFVVVTAGSVEMQIGREDGPIDAFGAYTLAVPTDSSMEPSVVYLPPRSAYQLTPNKTAYVAYVRATPFGSRAPAAFYAHSPATGEGMTTLLNEPSHAERLQLKIARFRASTGGIAVQLPDAVDTRAEALVHVQGVPADGLGTLSTRNGASLQLRAWDTLAFEPGESATLYPAMGADMLILTVLAA